MMDTKNFKDTFSAVHASDALRLEVLQMCKNEKKPIRLGTKILIVAAIVCLLATTAVAAPAVIRAIKGGRVELDKDVFLEVNMNPDAPDDILTHYLPVIPAGYKQYIGFKSDIERLYAWSSSDEGSDLMRPDEIQFMQWPGKVWEQKDTGNGTWAAWIDVPEGEMAKAEMTELGGMLGFLVESDYGYGSRMFFWSDGDYVFKLEVPDEYTDEQLAALIESVHVVENMEDYIWND